MSAQFQAMAGTTRPVADIRPVAGNVSDNANYGTPRSAVEGSCLVGNSSMYAILPNAMNSQIVSSFCWVKPTINGDVLQTFVTESGADSASYPWLFGMTATGELRVILRDTHNVNGKDYRTTALLQDGIWTHVGFTYNGTDLRVYINGQEQTVNRVVDDVLGNLLLSSSVGIGAKAQGDIPFASEIIGIVSYNTELTVDDIQLLLNFKYLGSESYLLKLDEASGNTIYDASGNNNHGTITNPYVNQWGKQDIYSHANQEGYTDSSGVRLPAISSLLDVNNNPLQYKGKAQQNSSLVEAACFHGDSIGSVESVVADSITDFIFEAWFYHDSGSVATLDIYVKAFGDSSASGGFIVANDSNSRLRIKCMDVTAQDTDPIITNQWYKVTATLISNTLSLYINDELKAQTGGVPAFVKTDDLIGLNTFAGRLSTFDAYSVKLGGLISGDLLELPLSEPIEDAANHTYFDVSGNGNHGTLTNGSVANEGIQDDYHYLEIYGHSGGSQLAFHDNVGNPVTRVDLTTGITIGNNFFIEGTFIAFDIGTNVWRALLGSSVNNHNIYFRDNLDGTSEFRMYDGISSWYVSGTISHNVRTISKFRFERNGNLVTLAVNGIDYPSTFTPSIDGRTMNIDTICEAQSTEALQGKIWNVNINNEAFYKLDGNADDSIGTNHGTEWASSGTPVYYETIDVVIPASQANGNKDALGDALYFQPTQWLGQSKLKLPETPEFIQANPRMGKNPIGWTLNNMTQDGNDFTGAVTASWDDTAYGDYTVDGIQFTAQDTRSGMILLDDTVNSGTYKTAKAYLFSNGSQWIAGSVNVNNPIGVTVRKGDIGELRLEGGVVNAYINGEFIVQVYNGTANYPKVAAVINETAFEVFTTSPTFTATGEAVAISKGDISTNIGNIGGKTYIGSNAIRVHSKALGSVKDKAEKIRTNN